MHEGNHPLPTLTARESSVFHLGALGHSVGAIAAQLCIPAHEVLVALQSPSVQAHQQVLDEYNARRYLSAAHEALAAACNDKSAVPANRRLAATALLRSLSPDATVLAGFGARGVPRARRARATSASGTSPLRGGSSPGAAVLYDSGALPGSRCIPSASSAPDRAEELPINSATPTPEHRRCAGSAVPNLNFASLNFELPPASPPPVSSSCAAASTRPVSTSGP